VVNISKINIYKGATLIRKNPIKCVNAGVHLLSVAEKHEFDNNLNKKKRHLCGCRFLFLNNFILVNGDFLCH